MASIGDALHQKIGGAASVNCRAYFLATADARYPKVGGFSLFPYQQPLGVPPGHYRVYYLSSQQDGEVIQTGAPLSVEIKGDSEPAQSATLSKKEQRQTADDLLLQHPQHLENLVDYNREMLADRINDNRQLTSKRMMYTREVAENLYLNRAYRADLKDSYGAMTQMSIGFLRLSFEIAKSTAKAAGVAEVEPKPPLGSGVASTLTEGMQLVNHLFSALGKKGGSTGGINPLEAIFGSGGDEDNPVEHEARNLLQQIEALHKKVADAEKLRKEPTSPSAPPETATKVADTSEMHATNRRLEKELEEARKKLADGETETQKLQAEQQRLIKDLEVIQKQLRERETNAAKRTPDPEVKKTQARKQTSKGRTSVNQPSKTRRTKTAR